MPRTPSSLIHLLESEEPPEGFLDWFTEAEVRAASEAGMAGKHEPLVRAWLARKAAERLELETAAASASRAQRTNRVAMWLGLIVALAALAVLLLPSLL